MNWPYVGRCLARAFSVRIIAIVFFNTILVAGFASVFWYPLLYVGIAIGVMGYLGAILNDGITLSCPHCHKLVKVGAGTCHHCGRDVTEPPMTYKVPPDDGDSPVMYL